MSDTMTGMLLGYIVWDPALGYLWGALLFVGVCVCLVLSYRRIRRRYSGSDVFLLLAPRVVVAFLLLMLFFDPQWAITQRVQEDLRFLFVQDETASMEVADRDETTRSDRAEEAASNLRELLPDNAEVKERRFKREMMDEETEQADEKNQESRTGIAQVLVDVARSHRAQNWDGVVMFTDGGDERFRVGNPPPVPVYFSVFGSDAGENNDLVVKQVDAPSKVQKETEFNVGVELQPHGPPQFLRSLASLKVRLQKRSEDDTEWKSITSKEVNLNEGARNVRFTVDGLEEEGRHKMRVVLESVSGELTELNNERHFHLNVVDSSLKALLFSAKPGQNESILRRTLEDDPGISVTALIRLREDRYLVQGAKDENKPKIEDGFPSSTDKLSRFDVVVVGSFPAKMWEQKQMETLTKFVRNGGAAVFLGGENSFGLGGYAGTPLDPLFPWRISQNEPELDVGRHGVTVTPAVVRQKVIRGWAEKMSAAHPLHIQSLNRPGKLRQGAVGLLNAASEKGEVPVLAVQTYGRGRVMGAATNTLWRWRTEGGEKRAAYNHLWRQGLRYLAKTEQGGGLLRVTFNREHYYPGETAEIDVEVAGEYTEGTLRVEATRKRNEEEEKLSLERRSGSANRFRTTTIFPRHGRYKFKFTAYHNNNELETYKTSVYAGARMNEGARIYPDFEFLEDIASVTGGGAYREDEQAKLSNKLRSQMERHETQSRKPLVQYKGIYLLLLILTLLAEWAIRRRKNLF